jgi:glycosyltransferase involved in cell wall biosynthesis
MASKIKVLHVTYDMHIGGTEQVIVNLIKGSDQEQFEMSILCIESPLGSFAEGLLEAGINITSLSRAPGFDASLVKQICKHIKQHNIDIVHCHQYTPYVYGVLGALFTQAKVIFTEHGRFYPDTSSWKRKLVNPILNRFTSQVTAISQATKQALVTYENFPEKDIDLVYNGILGLEPSQDDSQNIAKHLKLNSRELCLGTIARLDPIKNHTMMLKAFKQVLDTGIKVKLMIVGDGDERQNLTDLIEQLALTQHVILTGYEPKPQNHLALMDIYLLPSLSEGTSMTLLEAMSIGKPCIVTNAGGNPEIVEHNITGLVTPNDDEEAYAKAIIYLVSDLQQQKRFGQAAKARFNQLFNISNMVDTYHLIYLNCLPLNKHSRAKSEVQQ